MGERKLAGSAAVKAIAAARLETVNTMVESSNEANLRSPIRCPLASVKTRMICITRPDPCFVKGNRTATT